MGDEAAAAAPAEGLGARMRRSLGRKSLSAAALLTRQGSSSGLMVVRKRASQQSAASEPVLESVIEGAEELDAELATTGVDADAARAAQIAALRGPGGRTSSSVFTMLSDVFGRVVGNVATGPAVTNRISTTGLDDKRLNTIVRINVGGELFSTSLGTLLNGSSMFLSAMFQALHDDDHDPLPRDQDGNIFIDHDPKHFSTILNFLRANTPTSLPDIGTREWNELRLDADFFGIPELVQQMDDLVLAEQRHIEELRQAAKASRRRKSSTTDLLQKQGRELERMRVELHRLQFEKAKAEAEGRPMFAKMEFAYNLMVVGVTGNGKSSSLNTILDKQVCEVSGSQAQGTRGCNLRDGVIDNKHFISYLDTQGLGADTSISDEELLEQIMLSTESIRQMGIINNILIAFDLATRTTPASIANQLTLCELFTELRRSAFVCFTKWNTNSVMSEWNIPLKKWVRKFRRVRSIDQINLDPPSYEEMYRCYCQYLLKSLSQKEDGGAFAKMATLLTYFESRVLFLYNLDPVEMEDKEDGELDPYIEYLYDFYRKRALVALKRGSTVIKTAELPFLKDDEDTMADVAARLIEHRDAKIEDLEQLGLSPDKRKRFRSLFTDMYNQAAVNMEKKIYDIHSKETAEILDLLGHPEHKAPDMGCAVS